MWRKSNGVVLELQTTRLSSYLIQIICSLHEGFQPDDTIRIVQPPNNGTRTLCRFPLQCLSYSHDNVTYGQQNTMLSVIFTPDNSGLYSCIYNEDHGASASVWVTVLKPTDTATPAHDSSHADGLDTPSTAEHEETTNLTGASNTDEKAFTTSSTVSETPAAGSGFSIWVSCFVLIVYQCA